MIAGSRYRPPSAVEVPALVVEMVTWRRGEVVGLHPVERAALLHWKLVQIHPVHRRQRQDGPAPHELLAHEGWLTARRDKDGGQGQVFGGSGGWLCIRRHGPARAVQRGRSPSTGSGRELAEQERRIAGGVVAVPSRNGLVGRVGH